MHYQNLPEEDNADFPSFNIENDNTINPVSLLILAPSPLSLILYVFGASTPSSMHFFIYEIDQFSVSTGIPVTF